jgi:hydroxypyruvate reductase
MLTRQICEAAFSDAVRACDPAERVHAALVREPLRGETVLGLAIGKAAHAMARGAGPVTRGLVVTHSDHGPPLPQGWELLLASHPMPDATSLAAAIAAVALVESAVAQDVVLALISGGASALVELPREGLTLEELVERTGKAMAAGAAIRDLNVLRTQLSAIKGGKLAARSRAPVVTLVVSDVIGDDPHVIGSGPTVADRAGDRTEVIAPMAAFGEAMTSALAARGVVARRIADPIAADVRDVASQLASTTDPVLAWGEPTVRVPDDHGEGGRAQQLALELARLVRGSARSAFVAGSDGIDGPTRAAGAFVDGNTWTEIEAAGIDADAALRRCDAGRALAAVGALVITGPTGINHADVVVLS